VAEEILLQATRLFGERGYDGTLLQDMAQAVGLTRTGLYNYFKGKEDLLSALVADGSAHTARMLRLAGERGDIGPREKLGEVVRVLVGQRTAAPGRFRVLDREAV
jgi:AcrR family transcriptional regulator